MTEENGGSEYELRPPEPPSPSEATRPKPGEPGWVPPIPVIQKAAPAEEEVPADPDVQQHKAVAILAYICFLIPLLARRVPKFAPVSCESGAAALYYLDYFIGRDCRTEFWIGIGGKRAGEHRGSAVFLFLHFSPGSVRPAVRAFDALGHGNRSCGERRNPSLASDRELDSD